jgi:hypothetical protein
MVQAQIGQAVTQAVRGTKVGTVTIDDTTVDVVLRSRDAGDHGRGSAGPFPLPVTQKQTIDARKAAGTTVEDDQKAMQKQAQADQDAAAGDRSWPGLRESRTKVSQTISSLTSQLVRPHRAAGPALGVLPPATVTAPPVDPIATLRRPRSPSCSKSIETAKAQLTATDDEHPQAAGEQGQDRQRRARTARR